MTIRPYQAGDYRWVKQIYEDTGFYDEITDSEERINRKLERDPQSILVAEDSNEVVGTVSLIEDGRIAWLFRLFIQKDHLEQGVELQLIEAATAIAKERGYNEVHIFAPEEKEQLKAVYIEQGFARGNLYRWFWKKL